MLDAHDPSDADVQILHPSSRRLFRHWEALRAERPYPTREEFELAPIRDMLPDIIVVDRDHLRRSFRYRMAGSRACALFGYNLTGKDVLAPWGAFERGVLNRHLDTALREFQPCTIRIRLSAPGVEPVAAELLMLPVQMRGSDTVQLIGGMFGFRRANLEGLPAPLSLELVSSRTIWTEHRGAPLAARSLPPAPSMPTRPRFRHLEVIQGGKSAAVR